MRFQNPHFLYFLFAILVPIIIHLFNLRKHKIVYFSNVSFLNKVNSNKRKKNKIKQLIILLSRILIITSVVLAFSRPYLPISDNFESSEIIIYIDNSFSMNNISQQGRLLNVAKENGIKIIDNYKNKKFRIITNDFSSSENFVKNSQESKDYILNISNSQKNRTSEDILKKIENISPNSHTLFIISDFQKISYNLSDLLNTDSLSRRILVPIKKLTNNNIKIDSCYIKTPLINNVNSNSVFAKITNLSSKTQEDVLIKLEINKEHKAQQIISLSEKQTKEVELNFNIRNENYINGVISIEDYPINFDNKMYFSININSTHKICQVSQIENKKISKIFKNEDKIIYTNQKTDKLDYNLLKNQNLIILNEIANFSSGFINFLKTFVENGGSICVIPSIELNKENYNTLLKSLGTDLIKNNIKTNIKISKVNNNHKIFNNVFTKKKLDKDIFLPSTNQYYSLDKYRNTINERIFTLEDGNSFLKSFNKGMGEVFLFSSSLSNEANFTKHALFVTTFYNMAIQSANSENLYYTINKKNQIKLKKYNPNLENIYHLKSENTDIIAEHKIENKIQYLSTHNQIKKANHYQLTQEDELLSYISFNYDREESNTDQFQESDILNFINLNKIYNISIFDSSINLQENIEKIDKNKEYWKFCILLSLIFILIEILLIKNIIT